MARVMLDQGVVTARDNSLLRPGELAAATDAYYKPGNPAIWSVQSRTLYNSTPEAATITGVRFLGFDTVADIIVAYVPGAGAGKYRRGPATATGAFVDLFDGAGTNPALSLDNVYYNNQHILFGGGQRGVVVDSTYATRFLAMLNNTTAPTVNTTTGAGAGFKLTLYNGMTYWIEERVKVGSVIQRRNSSPVPLTATFISGSSSALQKPRITRPSIVNSDATHWAVYATATQVGTVDVGVPAGGGYPVGAEIGEAVVGTTFIDDLRTGTDPGLPAGAIYETMSVAIAGTYLQVPRNGPAPISTTGDTMEESIVVNDISDRAIIRYSWAEEIDKWPALNFIKFAEKEQDEVRCIRRVGASLVVLLRDTAWRVDYLPRPEDAEFNRGRCRSQIPGAPGVVGDLTSNSAVVFSMGSKYYLAYVSPSGLAMTDGFEQTVLTEDLDWPATVNLSVLDKATLIFNETKFQLELRYPSFGSSVNDKVILINVHPSHLKPGSGGGPRGKVTGPVSRPSTAAIDALISNLPGVYSAQGTSLYVEWNGSGTSDPATGVPISCYVQTGDLYLSDVGKQAEVRRVWLHHNAGAPASSIFVSLVSKNEKQVDSGTLTTIPGDTREANNASLYGLAEAFYLTAQSISPSQQVAFNYFAIDGDESGDAKN